MKLTVVTVKQLKRWFSETNLSWLIYVSTEALEIRTSIVFNLSFPLNTILSSFFFLFFIIDLCFFIPAVIVQIRIATAILIIYTGTQIYEVNAETDTQPLTVEAKIRKCPA